MKHVPNRFPITRKMVPVFNLIQKYKRKPNKARKHIYFYRMVLKSTLPDFAFSIVPLVLIDGCEGSENSLHIQDEYNLFFGNEYTSFSEGIYLPGKRYILFRQKHYTFQSKSIYFFQKEIMFLYISDIQLIILSHTMQFFRAIPPFGKVAADKEFPISTDGILYDFASIFCNKKTCYFRVNLLEIVW